MTMMPRNDPVIRKTVQDLRAAYVPTQAYQLLETYFEQLLDQRRADLDQGVTSNLRGIVLVGQSGAGKTSAMKELANRFRKRLVTESPEGIRELVGLHVPSPASMKFVGAAILQALGYPLARDRSASVIWDLVKQHLKIRQTLFLHLDEAQDLAQHQTDKERQAIVNTLKSLMENSQWPVGLILTGMPGLKTIVNQDPQLVRRLYPIEIERLSQFSGQEQVLGLLKRYCDRAQIGWQDDVKTPDFASRLMHAADYEFGLLAQFIVEAISHALFSEGVGVGLNKTHFADVYHMRTAAIPGFNPFIAEEFHRINPRQSFNDDEDGKPLDDPQ